MYHVFDKLRSVSAHGLDSLEDIDFPVLNDLLYARVSGTIDPATTSPVG